MLQMEKPSASRHPGKVWQSQHLCLQEGSGMWSLGQRLPSCGPAPASLGCDVGGATACLAFLPLFPQARRSSFLGKWCPEELKSTYLGAG